ncbi:ABC-three component system middle component 2 [Butyrivibrio sp. INlla14]|uniref:ABC-three component system middle component 2 n=1 Tax=Butyrivibrio sp. INlla14 TaxID=1520808 RepID=UPI000876E63D|nr:ABC-three component system middle component 2 [Butyrivibrio sp. INlla14]SCX84014.1 hypothetical protein SAMN02910371_00148 [Butyrivibrio sp. INlla14]
MNETTVIGSTFEISQRILLMLNTLSDMQLDEHQIAAIDFISIYAADFNILDENLHGYGNYRFSEYPARKTLISNALKQLILCRYVTLAANSSGFTYAITDSGKAFIHKIHNNYAKEYAIAVKAVIGQFEGADFKDMYQEIIRIINLSTKEMTLNE